MAAGLGFKTFTTGEVLTAADVNGYLMQGVLVFASSAARAAAITSPQEGQYSYLKDTNSTEYYDGAAWIAAPIGDITGVTAGTGISGGGTSGTVTITNDMATTITAAGDIVVGTGSGTYDNLPIGTTAQVLTADTTVSPYKVKWATPASSTPAFVGCRLTKTSVQSTSNVTLTTVSWDAETFDTNGFHDNTTNNSRITIPAGKAGKYLVTGTLTWYPNSNGYREVRVTKNGTAYTIMSFAPTPGGDGGSLISTIMDLGVGDYIELKAEQASGSSIDIKVSFSSFECQFLGA